MDDAVGIIGILIGFGLYFLLIGGIIAGMWKVFSKAGKPGWASLVPIYNTFVMIEIVGLPTWYIILCLIPCTAPFVSLYLIYGLAKSFGKDIGFMLLMIFIPFVGLPMLGFSDAKYVGPALQKD